MENQPNPLLLTISGMHCGGCVTRVTNALKKMEGVEVQSVEVGFACLTHQPELATRETIVSAINKLGFTATVS
jgi:copper chaperone CopZ